METQIHCICGQRHTLLAEGDMVICPRGSHFRLEGEDYSNYPPGTEVWYKSIDYHGKLRVLDERESHWR